MRAIPIYHLRQSSVRLTKLSNREPLRPVREVQGIQLNVKMSIKSEKKQDPNKKLHEKSRSEFGTYQSTLLKFKFFISLNGVYYFVLH